MDIISIAFIFIIGIIIGSFLNVVALRYNTGLSIYNDRSRCPTCNSPLKWYYLIPLFSYLSLRGKCATCKSPISAQYPVIEFITGLIFVGIYLRQLSLWSIYGQFQHGMLYSVLFFFYYAIVFSILLVIVVYDIRHKVIPNSFVYAFIALSVIKLGLFFYIKGYIENADLFDMFSPLILSLPIVIMWYVSGGRWIGFGDAKLIFGVGALLGFVCGLSALVLAFWIGALYSIILLAKSKIEGEGHKVSMKSEIPFAPFIILGAIIVFFSHIDVLGIGAMIDLLK